MCQNHPVSFTAAKQGLPERVRQPDTDTASDCTSCDVCECASGCVCVCARVLVWGCWGVQSTARDGPSTGCLRAYDTGHSIRLQHQIARIAQITIRLPHSQRRAHHATCAGAGAADEGGGPRSGMGGEVAFVVATETTYSRPVCSLRSSRPRLRNGRPQGDCIATKRRRRRMRRTRGKPTRIPLGRPSRGLDTPAKSPVKSEHGRGGKRRRKRRRRKGGSTS